MQREPTVVPKANILIVDDLPDNLRLLSAILTDKGYKVRSAISGAIALTACQVSPPDLILLDINMPYMSGYEVCQQLKAKESTQEIPIIFISALDEVADKVKAFALGGEDYITKPFEVQEVLARVEHQLTIQRLQKQLKEQNSRLQQEVEERIKAEESLRQQAKREQLLNEIAQRIRQSLNLEEILNTTVIEVRQLLQADRVCIYQFKPNGDGFIAVESVFDPSLTILDRKIYDPCFGQTSIRAYLDGRIQAIADLNQSNLPACYIDFLKELQVQANLVVPISIENNQNNFKKVLPQETIGFVGAPLPANLSAVNAEEKNPPILNDRSKQLYGLLIVHHCQSPRQWQAAEIDLLQNLSIQIAIAVQQGQLYQHLLLAEQGYQSIVENAVDGIFQTTPDGKYRSANLALAKLYGYNSPAELMAELHDIPRQLYVEPQRRSEFITLMETNNAVSGFESQVYRQDGKIIWISENARTVRDESGKLLYFEGTATDITARKVAQEALRYQQEQSEKLLLNILPAAIAQRLKLQETTIADGFEAVSVLFADLVGFTELSARKSPREIVEILNVIFSRFDQLAERYGLEKIKTIGDAYMVVAGLPLPRSDHADAIAQMALDMQAEIIVLSQEIGESLSIRIGINSGSVIAGVIGIKKFIYDLWGDTVNIASRMESSAIAGTIQVTDATYNLLKEHYLFNERGLIPIKGKGEMSAYFLQNRK